MKIRTRSREALLRYGTRSGNFRCLLLSVRIVELVERFEVSFIPGENGWPLDLEAINRRARLTRMRRACRRWYACRYLANPTDLPERTLTAASSIRIATETSAAPANAFACEDVCVANRNRLRNTRAQQCVHGGARRILNRAASFLIH